MLYQQIKSKNNELKVKSTGKKDWQIPADVKGALANCLLNHK